MSYNVIPTAQFIKEAKRLIRKYPSLKSELAQLNSTLADDPSIGTPLGNDAYKSGSPSRVKAKAKAEVPELSLIWLCLTRKFICSPFMIRLN